MLTVSEALTSLISFRKPRCFRSEAVQCVSKSERSACEIRVPARLSHIELTLGGQNSQGAAGGYCTK
jgi:hypothetical protein